MDAYEKIKKTRLAGRATALDYIENIFDEFTELHGDRRFADDRAVVGGIATLNGTPVTVIGIEKGKTMGERIERNFGCVSPEGYRKALRLCKQAEKFERPVVCIVDTQGAFAGAGAEERGAGAAIAENLYELMDLRTPIISLMVGEGGSGGALALAVADRVWMLENAYYSVVSPEACASILYKDASKAPEAAEHLRLMASDLYGFGIVEQVIREPDDFADSAQTTPFFVGIRRDLTREFGKLSRLTKEELLAERYEKYRKIGRYAENAGEQPRKGLFRRRTRGKV